MISRLKSINFSLTHIIIVGLLIRLILLPLPSHSDVNNHFIWGTYAQEFGFKGYYDFLNFGNYARPDYPPLAILVFTAVKYLYDAFFALIWQANITFPLFPSTITVFLAEHGYHMFLKLPGVLSDVGIALLIFLWTKEKVSSVKSRTAAALYFLNPAVIYLTAIWGQIDALATLFALLFIYLLGKKRLTASLLMLTVSLLLKATFVPLFAALLVWLLVNKPKLKNIVQALFASLLLAAIISSFFTTINPLVWLADKYEHIFMQNNTLPFLNLNAFNYWGLLLGLDHISLTQTVFGIPLATFAYLWGSMFISFATRMYFKHKHTITEFALTLYFTIFMFFPKMHERYLFPTIALLPLFYPTAKSAKQFKVIYATLSAVFLLNLYHWWYFPSIPFLISLLEVDFIIRLLCATNLVLFLKYATLKHVVLDHKI